MTKKDLLEFRMALDTCTIRVIYKGVEITLFYLLENLKFNYGEATMLKAYEILANVDVATLDIEKEVAKIIKIQKQKK